MADSIKKLVNISFRDADPIKGVSGLILLDALPPNVRDQVTMRLGERISFSNVLTAAKRVWPSSSAGLTAYGGFTGSGDVKDYRTQDDPQKRLLRCNCCKKLGHIRKDCNVECFGCGEKDHKRFECSRSTVHSNAGEGVTESSVTPKLVAM